MSLRISLSTLAQSFNIQFASGENGKAFEKETLDTFTTTLPSLRVQFRRRWLDNWINKLFLNPNKIKIVKYRWYSVSCPPLTVQHPGILSGVDCNKDQTIVISFKHVQKEFKRGVCNKQVFNGLWSHFFKFITTHGCCKQGANSKGA